MSDWNCYVKHSCGALREATAVWVRGMEMISKVCESCGDPITAKSCDVFVARSVYKGVLWNPLTWFKFELERKQST